MNDSKDHKAVVNKPDMVISAIFARIFCKPLQDGRYIAPAFMYAPMAYWQNCDPKLIFGSRKIVCHMPPEYDASMPLVENARQSNARQSIISFREIAKNILVVPTEEIMKRNDVFQESWNNVVEFGNALNQQVGISYEEFLHLQKGLRPGPWVNEVMIKE